MRLTAIFFGCSMAVSVATTAVAQTPGKTDKVDIVAATGCLRENPANTWTLVNATDPTPSSANAPSAKELASVTTKAGKNEFRLIGVGEFNLPAHRDHTVLVKGLYIKATPTSRLNVTSVTMVAPSCETTPKGLH